MFSCTHTLYMYHLPQSNRTALHLVFLTCSWWAMWSKHISSSDTLKRPDCHHHIFLFKSPFKASYFCPLTWIPHLGDHHHYPPVLILLPKSPFCHPVSLCLLALSDHPQQHIIQYLFTCLSRPTYCILFSMQYSSTLFFPLPPLPSFRAPPSSARRPCTSGRLSCYHPLFSPIPWSLFWFQTPFSWSIGLSLANDSEVVWTVVDSLLEGQLPHIPLIYSSLHWLMGRGVMGQPFIVEEAWPENK